MKIYLATWTEDNQGETLTKAGAKDRLMSYYFLKDVRKGFLKEYVETGKVRLKNANKDK
jgi:hypothetical protein